MDRCRYTAQLQFHIVNSNNMKNCTFSFTMYRSNKWMRKEQKVKWNMTYRHLSWTNYELPSGEHINRIKYTKIPQFLAKLQSIVFAKIAKPMWNFLEPEKDSSVRCTELRLSILSSWNKIYFVFIEKLGE